jgi:hypothetical protein
MIRDQMINFLQQLAGALDNANGVIARVCDR